MSTPAILDFEQLLRPITDDRPAGAALKDDDRLRGVYQAVKDAREAARTAEKKLSQAAWLEDADTAKAERPDWQKVFDLASTALAQHSKDLWIASWLIEALARLHGFAGLRDGFRLTRELVERFWDGIHPRPDEDGLSTTVAQLTGLNGSESEGALLAPIDQIPLTAGGNVRPLSNADYKQAIELDKLTDTDKVAQRIAKGAASRAMFDQAVRETPADHFRGLLDDLQQAIDEFFLLSEALESRCGGASASPPTSAIRAALTDVRERVQQLSRSVLGESAPDGSAENVTTSSAADGAAATVTTGGKRAQNREEAFRQLLQVAEFFRLTEPHSPVSYALEQAVRWGRMPLPELLSELLGDSAVRDDLFKRVGLIAPRASE